MKRKTAYVAFFCATFLFFVNFYLISQKSVIRLAYIVMKPWYTHSELGVLPLPFNQNLGSFVFKKKSNHLVGELQKKYQSGVDFIFYSSHVEDDIAYVDARKLVDIFIAAGADINFKYSQSGCTSVRNLIVNNQVKAANYMLEKGSDLAIKSGRKFNNHDLCTWDASDIYETYPVLEFGVLVSE